MRNRLNQTEIAYERLHLFVEYNTNYGFEIATNLLRDDGNGEKDVQSTLFHPSMESIYVMHFMHSTKNMMTVLVVTSRELTKDEYKRLKSFTDPHPMSQRVGLHLVNKYMKSQDDDMSMIYSDDNETADATMI